MCNVPQLITLFEDFRHPSAIVLQCMVALSKRMQLATTTYLIKDQIFSRFMHAPTHPIDTTFLIFPDFLSSPIKYSFCPKQLQLKTILHKKGSHATISIHNRFSIGRFVMQTGSPNKSYNYIRLIFFQHLCMFFC